MSIYSVPTWTYDRLVLRGGDYFAAMSRDQFFDFCRLNPEVPFERTAAGDLVITTLRDGETSRQNAELSYQLGVWSKKDGTGVAFDSSTGFWLMNGAMRSPDSAWLLRSRWEAITSEEQNKFPPVAPDFVFEMRSETDCLTHLRDKMQEYAENGVRLGWLIDPVDRRVEVYRPGRGAGNSRSADANQRRPGTAGLHA